MTSRVVTEALLAERVLVRATTEKEWMALVVSYARLMNWAVYHTHDSRRSALGYPDLTLVRLHRLIFAELKTETGTVTPAQESWLALLGQVPGVDCRVWRPSQWVEVRDALS